MALVLETLTLSLQSHELQFKGPWLGGLHAADTNPQLFSALSTRLQNHRQTDSDRQHLQQQVGCLEARMLLLISFMVHESDTDEVMIVSRIFTTCRF